MKSKNRRALSLLLLLSAATILLGANRLMNDTIAQTAAPNSAVTDRLLADEREIRFVVDEIDNAVDRKDWKTCREFFADDIDVDFSSLSGAPPARIKADALVGSWRRNLYADKRSHHMRSNHRITVTGDTAEVFSKGYAFNRLPSKTGSDLWEVWGDYRHTLARTARGWKVTGMSLSVTHSRGNERARDFVPDGQK